MSDSTKKSEDIGYSITPEVEYVLSKESFLPIKHLLDDQLVKFICYFRTMFATFCKQYDVNVDCSSAYFKFTQYIRDECCNAIKRSFLKLVNAMAVAMHSFHNAMIRSEPVIKFYVAKNIERFKVRVTIRPTHVAVQARIVQGAVKDAFLKSVVAKGKKIIDVGGGMDSMRHALHALKIVFPYEIVSVDRKKNLDMNFFDYGPPELSVITMVHSSYYMMPDLFLNLTKNYDVCGLALVLDGDTEVISTEGEDYAFKAVRCHKKGIYKVEGNIFAQKTADIKGRRFKGEIWYNRMQLISWGYKFQTFPSSNSELVRRHLVWFYKDSGSPKKIDYFEPLTVGLREGKLTEVSSKVPSIYRLFHDRPILDKYCLYGLEHYQTDKADGINMKLMISKIDHSIILVDRLGMSFNIYDENGLKYVFPNYYHFVLSVDIIAQPTEQYYQLPDYLTGSLPDSKFKIFFNQVITNIEQCQDVLFSQELFNYRRFIRDILRKEILGIKNMLMSAITFTNLKVQSQMMVLSTFPFTHHVT